jgi:hypothetical protein
VSGGWGWGGGWSCACAVCCENRYICHLTVNGVASQQSACCVCRMHATCMLQQPWRGCACQSRGALGIIKHVVDCLMRLRPCWYRRCRPFYTKGHTITDRLPCCWVCCPAVLKAH